MNFIRDNWGLLAFLIVLAFTFGVLFSLRRRFQIIAEFFLFLKERKLWWIAPVFIVLILIMILLVAGAYSPYIYTIF